ncbi:hypothetical protein CEP53_006671 [Fusarium sp. AF-6]|nr:hypothetical protein CEP53_006671 [Fusarium sp. AF-6]
MVLGTVAEVVGYIGRILLHNDVWNRGAFTMQITCIILRPTFICAGIYLTLKHVALALHPGLSRMPAAWYPRVFLPTDISCLVVQALGGGLAAAGASQNDPSLSEKGNSAIMAGVALQVVVLVAFGVMAIDYLFRVSRIVETEGGWGNHIMQHESSFMVQDGGLVLLAAILVTVVHPGLFFPPMYSGKAQATTYSDTDKNEALSSGAILENV